MDRIRSYLAETVKEHSRYRSWEHCYQFFRTSRPATGSGRDLAALHLAFYLASWGMYRGSSFLLRHDYTIHRLTVDVLCEPRFEDLWACDFGSSADDRGLIPLILELVDCVRQAYRPFAVGAGSGGPTDTLVTKVILGTVGCLPACDQLFVTGFKRDGYQYSYFNRGFVERVLQFCQANLGQLRSVQSEVQRLRGTRYPLMKLVDMRFWQAGYELTRGTTA
jgi:hypothetical protein